VRVDAWWASCHLLLKYDTAFDINSRESITLMSICMDTIQWSEAALKKPKNPSGSSPFRA